MLGAIIGLTLFGLILSGATASIVASKLDGSAGAWFVAGFFLGLIGILLAATMNDKKAIYYGSNESSHTFHRIEPTYDKDLDALKHMYNNNQISEKDYIEKSNNLINNRDNKLK